MKSVASFALPLALVLVGLAGFAQPKTVAGASAADPRYARDGSLAFPADYRQWTYLTSGFDMSYSASMRMDHHMFDNVFVDPSAYRSFARTGTWPDKTMLVLELRAARGKGSINRVGDFQTEAMGVEVHVRDDARFPGRWAFFAFDDGGRFGTRLPQAAACYSCHANHAAVDTTFVQFYPTLLPVATSKGTLSRAFLRENGR